VGIIAIVGRPNVGKSTLFNRLTGGRNAIVDETSGVTRDRHYGSSDWCGREFSVVDTGGYTTSSEDIFSPEIRKQVMLAIEEADVIFFMVDVTSGITEFDEQMAALLRKINKPTLVVVNKVDNNNRIFDSYTFHKFGLGNPYCICSLSGSGTGELLDEALKYIPDNQPVAEDGIPRIAIVGKPNVGKSSLTNALLGEERNIVTPIAGTTRDAVHSRYTKFGQDFFLIDTAGLRKKGKVHENLEFYSVMRAIRAIESADVCVLMVDAQQGIEQQDMSIFNLIVRNKKGCVVVINKWDLVEKDTNTMRAYRAVVERHLQPLSDIPVLFTSVTAKQRIFDLTKTISQVYENRRRTIPTRKLNDIMLPLIEITPPPAVKGKLLKIKLVQQVVGTPTPTFLFFCNHPQYIRQTYMRFLENKLRENFNFSGVPIQIFMRQK
jgi:GTP-binding protein